MKYHWVWTTFELTLRQEKNGRYFAAISNAFFLIKLVFQFKIQSLCSIDRKSALVTISSISSNLLFQAFQHFLWDTTLGPFSDWLRNVLSTNLDVVQLFSQGIYLWGKKIQWNLSVTTTSITRRVDGNADILSHPVGNNILCLGVT